MKYVQIDGGTTGNERSALIDRFREDAKCAGALCTYKVCGEGLSFTECRIIIRIENWWNEATHEQAESRIYRMGQDQATHMYTVICKNTIEEKVSQICHEKAEMADQFLKGTTRTMGKGSKGKLDMYSLGRILGC